MYFAYGLNAVNKFMCFSSGIAVGRLIWLIRTQAVSFKVLYNDASVVLCDSSRGTNAGSHIFSLLLLIMRGDKKTKVLNNLPLPSLASFLRRTCPYIVF